MKTSILVLLLLCSYQLKSMDSTDKMNRLRQRIYSTIILEKDSKGNYLYQTLICHQCPGCGFCWDEVSAVHECMELCNRFHDYLDMRKNVGVSKATGKDTTDQEASLENEYKEIKAATAILRRTKQHVPSKWAISRKNTY